MSDMRDALSRAGVVEGTTARGDVHIVDSSQLRWTYTPSSPTHPVVILASPDLLQDSGFPLAIVVPCTSSPISADGTLEVPIPPAEIGSPKQTYAVSYLVQPLHKCYLGKWVGTVSDDTLATIEAGVIASLGIAGVVGEPGTAEE